MVNINSFTFSGIQSVIVTKLKTSCNQNNSIIEYIIDIGSDGKVLLYDTFKT